MYRTTKRIRKAGVAALVAATTLSTALAFAPSAGAAPAEAGDLSLIALSQPAIGVGKANQPAGVERLTVTAGDTLTAGDQILITVDDSSGSTCLVGDTLRFTALPTVTVSGTATIVSTLEASSVACGTDTLRLNVTSGGTATVTISGIAYTVGTGASNGPVDVQATLDGDGIFDALASNAFITTAAFSANTPPTGASELENGSYAISPLVITEQTTSGADADLCIYFDDDIEDTPAPAPTVAVTGGSDTADLTVDTGGDWIFVDVTPSGPPTTSTFTISGVRLERDDRGVQSATVYADNNDVCGDGDGEQLSADETNVGGVTDVERFGGSTRFTTAQILFEDEFDCPTDVIIARADLYPDALAASYLAGHAETGILLTNTNDVPAATLNALRNEGVDNVYLMGGTTAISAAVATQLDATANYDCNGNAQVAPDATTLTVQRIGGVDRYETAQLVAEFPGLTQAGDLDITPTVTTDSAANTAIIASGENFPDALAAGPLAFHGHHGGDDEPIPLLLTRQAAVPAVTLGALGDLGIVNVIVMGGTVAVSDAAVAQLTAAGYNVRRIAGTTRQGTAVALATASINEWGFDDNDASLAAGDNFPDSLAGGPWAGRNPEVILLTGNATTLSAETTGLIATWENQFGNGCGGGELDDLNVFGGTVAIAASTVQDAVNAATLQRGVDFCL